MGRNSERATTLCHGNQILVQEKTPGEKKGEKDEGTKECGECDRKLNNNNNSCSESSGSLGVESAMSKKREVQGEKEGAEATWQRLEPSENDGWWDG